MMNDPQGAQSMPIPAPGLAQRVKNAIKSAPLLKPLYNALRERAVTRVNVKSFSRFYVHDRMLADRTRLDAYYAGINKHVAQGDHVVELGTGTGILSFFASKNAERICALDHSSIIEKARLLAKHNNISNIEFINTRSDKFQHARTFDVLIHEQIGNFLFEENMVANIIDLRDRVLKPGGKILPSQFELFIAPMQIKDEFRHPFFWEHKPYGINYDVLKSHAWEQVAPGYFHRKLRPFEFDFFLCEPISVLSFDLCTVTPDVLPEAIRFSGKVQNPGRLDGYCVYFVAKFDDEIMFSNSPQQSPETSWKTPLLRVESTPCDVGDRLEFELTMESHIQADTWRWNITPTVHR